MNIMTNTAAHGSKIVFSNPANGNEHDRATAARHLVVGQKYTVDRVMVHSWCTDVYLVEVPGTTFNSVLFSDA